MLIIEDIYDSEIKRFIYKGNLYKIVKIETVDPLTPFRYLKKWWVRSPVSNECFSKISNTSLSRESNHGFIFEHTGKKVIVILKIHKSNLNNLTINDKNKIKADIKERINSLVD